jgi:hypothetical protein
LDNYSSSLYYYFSKHYDIGRTAYIKCQILQAFFELQPELYERTMIEKHSGAAADIYKEVHSTVNLKIYGC